MGCANNEPAACVISVDARQRTPVVVLERRVSAADGGVALERLVAWSRDRGVPVPVGDAFGVAQDRGARGLADHSAIPRAGRRAGRRRRHNQRVRHRSRGEGRARAHLGLE